MGRHCCVGPCNNDDRYPDLILKKGHVTNLKFHILPKDPERRRAWSILISKGRQNFIAGKWTHVCSNHFMDAEPTNTNPNPTLYLTVSDWEKKSPRKRVLVERVTVAPAKKILTEDLTEEEVGELLIKEPVPMYLQQLNQEYNLRFFTGFQNFPQCAAILNHLKKKAAVMTYWDGIKKMKSSKKAESANEKLQNLLDSAEVNLKDDFEIEFQKAGPSRKLRLDQEFLMVMMKLRLGAISWISPGYGGRCSDVFIVRDSGFLDILEPYSQVMADRGFKIKTDLAMVRCTLCIPPSAAKGVQMTEGDVKETSQIANVRIFVEQAIKRMKDYRILKTELSLLLLPICDDIVKVCCSLCNLKEPLVV
eukprot:Seg2301.6 transcript_id=Seg2301.6/GoldUCD/mRNA.D3Y31 product="THAP domain-containing protein 2" protein_id=Seg2301.6/GoldUCD/D3Y31